MVIAAGIASIIWIVVGISYLAIQTDLECLVAVCSEPKKSLKPNEAGDFFAGLCAPLAFLWLYVATMLQRQELALQRAELKETREVMALQKEEMKRAADENSQQTKIMTENLKNTASQLEYDRLDTLLYSTALFVFTNRSHFELNFANQRRDLFWSSSLERIPLDRSNFDRVYAVMSASTRSLVRQLNENSEADLTYVYPIQPELFARTMTSFVEIKRMRDEVRNELINTRLDALNFEETLESFAIINHRLAR